LLCSSARRELGALVTQIYLAGVSVQQIRVFARLPWSVVVAVVLIPGVIVSFDTRWVLDHVMNWLAYNGVLFVGLSAVLFVDFFVLRRELVMPAQLFAVRPGQQYWFWGRGELGRRGGRHRSDRNVPMAVRSDSRCARVSGSDTRGRPCRQSS
jgi:purine-cytosine permease-like protein